MTRRIGQSVRCVVSVAGRALDIAEEDFAGNLSCYVFKTAVLSIGVSLRIRSHTLIMPLPGGKTSVVNISAP
jgi:hypothetical protein